MSRVVIYTKKTCSWCEKLKEWLRANQIDFKEVDVEENEQALNFIRNQGLTTVPQIFIDGIHRAHEPVYSGLLEWIQNETSTYSAIKVVKRDEQVVDFNELKIHRAIEKANNETNELTVKEVKQVARTVVEKIDKNIIGVEEI